MITLRRAQERQLLQCRKQQVWHTFGPAGGSGLLTGGFGTLESLDEHRLPPGAVSTAHPRQEAEIVTYVFKGALAQEDSSGSSGVMCAGEFQRMTISRGMRHKETNASRSDWAHIFRISLRPPQMGLECAHEQQRFAAAERHNVLCIVASPDGRKGSLRLLQDALICSSVLDPGRHLVHELSPARSAWLHVICGEATLDDLILVQGDGAGVTAERSVSLTAQENTELLLVDLGPPPRSLASGAGP
jgi:redox-sensitive bicupin YhaK (pirin superfamily)